MAIVTINYGFKVNGKEPIDVRLILSKEDMLACSSSRPKYALPDLYFALCTDDGYFYKYDVNAELDPELGKFRKIDYLTKVDKDELQALIAAETARAEAEEADLDERIRNLEARGRFLSSWDCVTGKPETEPERKPYAYKSGDYYIISIVKSTTEEKNYQPEPIQYTGAASTIEETRAVAPGDYYTYDGSKWVWVKNTQQTVTFRQIAGNARDNLSIDTELGLVEAQVTAEQTRAIGVENSLGTRITTEVGRAQTAEANLQKAINDEASSRATIDAQLGKAIQDEYDRAIAEEATLQANIEAEATRASTKETEIETALASEKLAREAADTELENKKLNVPEGVKDPEDPGKGGPYNISYAFDIAADAEKAVVTTHTVTLDNNFEEKKFSAAVPGATEATAGLMTAADKKSLNELPGKLATETEERKAADLALQANIDAEAARAKAEEAKKVNKEVIGTNGKAEIFNEADGGGAKFTHNDGSESFVGVNDGGQDGLMAQIYADKLVDGKWTGAKIDVTNQGMYYTVGNKSFAERAIPENELATKKDVAAAGKVQDVKVDGVSVVDADRIAQINDRASKQALADEVTRASGEETRIDTALQSEVIRAQAEEAKKADLPGLCPPWLNPTGETPYPWFMASLDVESQGKGPDAEGNIKVDVGAYNFNQKAYFKWEKSLPFAASQTKAGLATASDKIKIDHSIQDTDTLILQCSYE